MFACDGTSRGVRRLAILVAVLSGIAGPAAAAAAGKWAANAGTSDQVIVRFRDGTPGSRGEDAQTLAGLHSAAARAGLKLKVLRRGWNNALVLKLDRHLPDDALAELVREIAASDADVQFAEPDRRKRIAAVTPNDPYYSLQWHYQEPTAGISLPPAWSLTTGAGVVVAVLDTGYRPHADLAASLVGGYDFITDAVNARDATGRDSLALDPGDWTNAGDCGDDADATDSSWHGTHVAGTIAAVTGNNLGVAGVAYGAKVLPVRVLGKCGGYDSDIADGIVWASGGTVSGVPANPNPAKVLNLSLGGFGACTTTFQTAIDAARARGAVVVVAAGNDGDLASNYAPANCTGVIAVGAVGRTGARTAYSNHGDKLQIAAPGGDMSNAGDDGVLSTSNDGARGPGNDAYYYYQGTSMATPHVAGVAAMMIARNPSITPNQVLARMRASAKLFPAGDCVGCGAGIVDAYWSATMATATPVPEAESNDTRATAQSITASTATIGGLVASTTDADYYKVTLSAGRQLRASVAAGGTTKDFDLYLYNSTGAQLRKSIRGAGQTDRVIYDNTSATTITLYVKVAYHSGGSGTYTLTIRR
jgi:serine protease